ncbi:MAG: leucine-rich repeat protein [Oscillospiraceae bacterium]|nr:leucine-rich repeat protein [Oscillospiraceae bacterium]
MRKKVLTAITLAAVLCSTLQPALYRAGAGSTLMMSTFAADEETYTEGTYEDLTYRRYSDYIEITGCDENTVELIIPAEIDGLPVTRIKNWAFAFSENMTSVVMPESIVYTGMDSFASCKNLSSVTLPDSLEEIMIGTFSDCSSLKSIKLPASCLRLRASVFSYCTSLEEVIFPDHQVDVYSNVFQETAWLKAKQAEDPLVIVDGTLIDGTTCTGDVVIPDDVTIISSGAFSMNSKINSVVIPASVKNIWDETFYYCTHLVSVDMKGVEYIGPSAFNGCFALDYLTLPASLKTISEFAFEDCGDTSTVVTYCGTKEQWAQVDNQDNSLLLFLAKIIYAPEDIAGDINGDGAFNVAEAVALQKWLLADGSADVKNWELGDLCKDDCLDVFDMIIMRQMLADK